MQLIRIWRKGKVFEVTALPAADSHRMLTPTTGVLEAEFRMIIPALMEGQGGADTGVRDGNAMVGVRKSEETKEDPTPEIQKAVARSQEVKWKSKRKLKNSSRKDVEKLTKEVDRLEGNNRSICG